MKIRELLSNWWGSRERLGQKFSGKEHEHVRSAYQTLIILSMGMVKEVQLDGFVFILKRETNVTKKHSSNCSSQLVIRAAHI